VSGDLQGAESLESTAAELCFDAKPAAILPDETAEKTLCL
jgi:hypothetical protein